MTKTIKRSSRTKIKAIRKSRKVKIRSKKAGNKS
jgi:hypothetical protein